MTDTTTDDFPVEGRDEVVQLAEASAEPGVTPEEAANAILSAATVIPHRPYRGQAAHDATRRERKLRAADTIKANAKAAQAAKRKAQAKAPTVEGRAAFEKRAAEITERINKDK